MYHKVIYATVWEPRCPNTVASLPPRALSRSNCCTLALPSLPISVSLPFLPYRDRCELNNIMRAVYTYSQGAAYKHNALWLCKRRKTWATAKPPLYREGYVLYVYYICAGAAEPATAIRC